jgi:hypothetical protein
VHQRRTLMVWGGESRFPPSWRAPEPDPGRLRQDCRRCANAPASSGELPGTSDHGGLNMLSPVPLLSVVNNMPTPCKTEQAQQDVPSVRRGVASGKRGRPISRVARCIEISAAPIWLARRQDRAAAATIITRAILLSANAMMTPRHVHHQASAKAKLYPLFPKGPTEWRYCRGRRCAAGEETGALTETPF